MNQDETNLTSAAKKALTLMRETKVEPRPYLKSKVLMNMRGRRESFGSHRWLRWFWPALSGVLLVLLISVQSMRQEATYRVFQPYMVRIDLRSLDSGEVGYAVVELQDDKLQFTSKQYKISQEVRSLTIDWQNLADKQFLPVVVMGTEAGLGRIKVKFYTQENTLVENRDIRLNFAVDKTANDEQQIESQEG